MRIDAINMLKQSGDALKKRDPMHAFSLYEFANHLRLLMRGEVTLEQWNNLYVGADREPLDIDTLLPPPSDT